MEDEAGIVFVRRIRWWSEKATTRPRLPALDLSEDQIAHRYRGVDGRPWPSEPPIGVSLESGLADLGDWPAILQRLRESSGDEVYDAVILAKQRPILPQPLPGVEFLGFDFGFYNDECSVFSSVYHECIHSPVPELRLHAQELNDSLLLPTFAEVLAYANTRRAVKERGVDVEGGECAPIAIFGTRR